MDKKQVIVDNPGTENIEEDKDLEQYYMEDLFPLALMYGMTSQEFWYDDPSLMWSYRIFFENKQKYESQIMNHNAWLNGLYVFDAVSKSIANAFRKSGSQAISYMDSPIDFDKKQEKKEKISTKAKAHFNYWAKLGERR